MWGRCADIRGERRRETGRHGGSCRSPRTQRKVLGPAGLCQALETRHSAGGAHRSEISAGDAPAPAHQSCSRTEIRGQASNKHGAGPQTNTRRGFKQGAGPQKHGAGSQTNMGRGLKHGAGPQTNMRRGFKQGAGPRKHEAGSQTNMGGASNTGISTKGWGLKHGAGSKTQGGASNRGGASIRGRGLSQRRAGRPESRRGAPSGLFPGFPLFAGNRGVHWGCSGGTSGTRPGPALLSS